VFCYHFLRHATLFEQEVMHAIRENSVLLIVMATIVLRNHIFVFVASNLAF
jgi:hypothetical protein